MEIVHPTGVSSAALGKFLRHKESGCWMGIEGSLVRDFREARPIKSILEAMDLCRHLHLSGMELVLKFDQSSFDVVLPMD